MLYFSNNLLNISLGDMKIEKYKLTLAVSTNTSGKSHLRKKERLSIVRGKLYLNVITWYQKEM